MDKNHGENYRKEAMHITGSTFSETTWALHEARIDSLREEQRSRESDEYIPRKHEAAKTHSSLHRRVTKRT